NWKHFALAEYRNCSKKLIHSFFADYVVYQSEFVRKWWNRFGFRKAKNFSVIYNGVDTSVFQPMSQSDSEIALICLEGVLDYSPYAVELLNRIRKKLPSDMAIKLYGRFEARENHEKLSKEIEYFGPVARNEVPNLL